MDFSVMMSVFSNMRLIAVDRLEMLHQLELWPGDLSRERAEYLAAGAHKSADRLVVPGAADVSVLLHRSGAKTQALDSVCTHTGGPLDEGKIADGCVRCP